MHAHSSLTPRPLTAAIAWRDAGGIETDRLRLVGVTRDYARGKEIFGEGEKAEFVYSVIRGAVRAFRVLADGRRQISDFYLPGDVFGVEPGADHGGSAEALCDTVLVVARRSVLVDEGDGAMSRRLWRLAIDELKRCQDHLLTLGCRTASERVANFLSDLAERLDCGTTLELPMSRQDIADYLGLTIETVSRCLTQFQVAGLIKLHGCRTVELCRPRALGDLCE